jgi:hypothetical protein
MDAGMNHRENRQAQIVMKELGITYQHSTPQSMADSWQFWNCENIPAELPSFITEMKNKPMKSIGFGLSQADAEKIRDYSPPTNNGE